MLINRPRRGKIQTFNLLMRQGGLNRDGSHVFILSPEGDQVVFNKRDNIIVSASFIKKKEEINYKCVFDEIDLIKIEDSKC